jgi:putative ABC transport system substrate-binding protein
MGLQVHFLNASTSREIDAAFATIVRERLDALLVAADPFFVNRRVQLSNLASHHSIPATYAVRNITEAGGLMSYGTSLTDALHQVGVYAGRILKGAKPAELPVVQATKFELVINAQTARILGLTVPQSLLASADDPKRPCGCSGEVTKLMPHTSLPPIPACRTSQISLLHRHGCNPR